jgi:hypothetical protein
MPQSSQSGQSQAWPAQTGRDAGCCLPPAALLTAACPAAAAACPAPAGRRAAAYTLCLQQGGKAAGSIRGPAVVRRLAWKRHSASCWPGDPGCHPQPPSAFLVCWSLHVDSTRRHAHTHTCLCIHAGHDLGHIRDEVVVVRPLGAFFPARRRLPVGQHSDAQQRVRLPRLRDGQHLQHSISISQDCSTLGAGSALLPAH